MRVLVSILFLFGLSTFAFAAPAYRPLPPVLLTGAQAEVDTASSPDNAHASFSELIDKAKKSIDITVYIFRSDQLADHLVAALDRGVSVRLLMDGWPVGKAKASKVDPQSLYIAKRITEHGGAASFLASDSSKRDDRRFKYIHAKYAIVDGASVFVSSENFGANSGMPVTGSTGNRGWSITIKNLELAKYYAAIFSNDWRGDDVVAYGKSPDYTLSIDGFKPERNNLDGTYVPVARQHYVGNMNLERVMSPDDASAENRAIIGAIKNASISIDIQNLSFAPHWGSSTDTAETSPSPVAEAVLAAARRGLKVRILLQPLYALPKNSPPKDPIPPSDDGESGGEGNNFFQGLFSLKGAIAGGDSGSSGSNSKDNRALLESFRDIAKRENLDLEANFFWLEPSGIRALHNKGMIVDQKTVLVSSINWVENSMKNNREAAILVTHQGVASYYQSIFQSDWDLRRSKR